MNPLTDTKPEKDYPEDWHHENGQYYCRCVHCKELFIGYKRRVVCKECSTNLEKASSMMSDKGYEVGSLEDIPQRDGYEMNERILELAVEANDQTGNKFDLNYKELDSFLEKFAELIVQECIGCCDEVDRINQAYIEEYCVDPENGPKECIQVIKAHFGVEE